MTKHEPYEPDARTWRRASELFFAALVDDEGMAMVRKDWDDLEAKQREEEMR